MLKELFQLPNLVSLSRIALTPLVGYFLAQDSMQGTIICCVLLVIAAITDGLDGYLARKMNKISQLGIALDPIADKIFAGVLVLLLIFYRDFPLWLAGVIIGRDLLILLAGSLLLRGRKIVVPSNITGKYAFGMIAFLLASYVVRFEFGIWLTTWLTLIFIVASLVNYTRVFIRVKNNKPAPVLRDKPVYKIIRFGLSLIALAVFFYRFYIDLF